MAHAVTLLVGISEFVGLIECNQVPGDGTKLILHPAGIVVRQDDDLVLIEWVVDAFLPLSADTGGIQDYGGKVELLTELSRPLTAQGGGADDEQLALALCPVLAKHKPGLDGFAEAHFIGQNNSFGEGRAQGEQGCLNLMGVEINAGIEKRC